IAPKYREKAVLMTDVAAEPSKTDEYTKKRGDDNTLRCLMVGRLDAWRGFDLAVEALAMATKMYPNIQLDILGDGSDRQRISQWMKRLGLESHVTLHGKVPMEVYYQMMADCDVVLNPSLKEGAVTTAFDSMAFGRPLVCIDTGGYTRYFNNEYAALIPRGSREQVIKDLADAIVRLTDRDLRTTMGRKAQKAAQLITWEKKGEEIERILNGIS
ncbi:MAG: glycosyltransferase family 4 protein, partial [Prevotella sp.]|nr:glycosyltransferase family 4 protein [Prevotella sp.]